ncbi:SGNH/GDSL hydrolase family protein [Glutamicibacter protophormiae]|uniref:SGNH/GDSL hydrolase family protein n=1 Tax=Glutamicibacter protophormiae TaxID=37930 RepID=UPI003A9127B8
MSIEDFEQAQYLSAQVEQARQRAVLAASDSGASRDDARSAEQQAREYAKKAGLVVVNVDQARDETEAAAQQVQENLGEVQTLTSQAGQAATQAKAYSDLTTSAIGEAYNATERLESYVLRPAGGEKYAIPFADTEGFAAGGVTNGGVFNFEKPPTIMGAPGVMFQPVKAPGYAQVFVDRDGYMAMGITTEGEIVTYKGGSPGDTDSLRVANDALGYTKTPGNKITFAGDSLTEGYFDGSPGPTTESWATKLITLLGGSVTGTNLGLSGYTVDEEALRVGALQPELTVSGGSIPASGSVSVTMSTVIGWRTANRSLSFVGTIAGVPGTLARASDGTYTFTRTTTGDAVSVSSGVKFVSEHNAHSGEIIMVLLGRNDVSLGIKASDATVAEHVVAGITRIVQWQSRDISKVLVLSVTNAKDEIRDTAGYKTVKAINDQLSELYGPRFLDIRTALVHDSLAAMGIAPTSGDLTAMANDAPPPSIMDDGTHWSREGHTFVAQLVHKYLTDREWTD